MGRTGTYTAQVADLLEGQAAPEMSHDRFTLFHRQPSQCGRRSLGIEPGEIGRQKPVFGLRRGVFVLPPSFRSSCRRERAMPPGFPAGYAALRV
jgi:hypothetical protein